MKKVWNLVEKIVARSPLATEQERRNVLEKLDYTLGANALEEEYPLDTKGLTEEEFAIYKQIILTLNDRG